MSIYLNYTVYEQVNGKSKVNQKIASWKLGKPFNDNLYVIADSVYMVQANGIELEYIINEFPGLPRTNSRDGIVHTSEGAFIISPSRAMRWYGDHAKFIAANLPNYTKVLINEENV